MERLQDYAVKMFEELTATQEGYRGGYYNFDTDEFAQPQYPDIFNDLFKSDLLDCNLKIQSMFHQYLVKLTPKWYLTGHMHTILLNILCKVCTNYGDGGGSFQAYIMIAVKGNFSCINYLFQFTYVEEVHNNDEGIFSAVDAKLRTPYSDHFSI